MKRPNVTLAELAYSQRHLAKMPVVIGHARLATSGAPEDNRNNHPFDNGRFVVIHNGIVTNDFEFDLQSECDSEAIIHALAETGKNASTIECIRHATTRLRGMVTAALLDRRDPGAIWLWKNKLGYDVHYTPHPQGLAAFCSLSMGLEATGLETMELDDDVAVRLAKNSATIFTLPPQVSYVPSDKYYDPKKTIPYVSEPVRDDILWPDVEENIINLINTDVTWTLPKHIKDMLLNEEDGRLVDCIPIHVGAKNDYLGIYISFEDGKWNLTVNVESEE